jgi:hypothetical protein
MECKIIKCEKKENGKAASPLYSRLSINIQWIWLAGKKWRASRDQKIR